MKDRAQQVLHLLALDPIAETVHDRNSYGFRRERSPADAKVALRGAIDQCFNVMSRKISPGFVAEGDIQACFDEISHQFLLEQIPKVALRGAMDRLMLHKWLKAGYMAPKRATFEKHAFHPTEKGTPQGGPMAPRRATFSPALANLTLNGMEGLLRETFPEGSKAHGP